jgi:hypothetical protein
VKSAATVAVLIASISARSVTSARTSPKLRQLSSHIFGSVLSPINLGETEAKVPERVSKKDHTEMTAHAATILREEARFRWPSLQYHQERIWRLKDWLSWGHRRVRAIYNGENGVVLRGHEALRIHEIELQQQARKREANNALRKSQAEYRELEARIAALEALFAAVDEEHGRPHMDALRDLSRQQGGISQGAVGGPENGGR